MIKHKSIKPDHTRYEVRLRDSWSGPMQHLLAEEIDKLDGVAHVAWMVERDGSDAGGVPTLSVFTHMPTLFEAEMGNVIRQVQEEAV